MAVKAKWSKRVILFKSEFDHVSLMDNWINWTVGDTNNSIYVSKKSPTFFSSLEEKVRGRDVFLHTLG